MSDIPPPTFDQGIKVSEELVGVGPAVRELQEKIASANGAFIPLSKPAKNGDQLLLKVVSRNFEPDPDQVDNYEEAIFHGRKSMPPQNGLCLVSVFAKPSEGDPVPIGRNDWMILGTSKDNRLALAGLNMPKEQWEQLIQSDPDQKRADEKWFHRRAAFLVEPEYPREGLGKLLVASALAALDRLGVEKFDTSTILKPAAADLWKKLGVGDKVRLDTEGFVYPDTRHITIQGLLKDPQIEKWIAEFL